MVTEKDAVHGYRSEHREGVYQWMLGLRAAGNPMWMLTFTYDDKKVMGEPSEKRLLESADKRLRKAGVPAYITAERGKGDGRLHIHGIAVGKRNRLDEVVTYWHDVYGFTHVDAVTDLMGAVFYVTKAIGPETYWTFSVPVQRRLRDAEIR